jgi:hypothetical protein
MTVDCMSQGEIEAFARKLEAFEATLSRQERDILHAVLTRAGQADVDDVEGHGLSRTSIATLVLMAASATGAVGVTAVHAGPAHYVKPATQVHRVVSVVGDDKGGSETITYSSDGGANSN